ncbi:N-acetylneuraminate synthase family protein [Halostagnicola sp. A-GB9-2]|uniref:N-acetylneuraminate synthase family protein n=1 Tax=Halostagnicola sp. A-GB9-2 TaxID=3048066 RepID=UPI0024C0A0A4|nr:N-acetylneuraminate synthase family protein [Halostagnicola sp. A-GB9-2]MDJ1431985.1 N-acetylneuraminate synthase family protein [Halostagnicola sp. A-GB9-2]
METFDIGNRSVGPGEPTYVIAEAGSNHNGDLEIAKELIDVAADAGADAVKFQTFRAEDLYVDDRELVDDPAESTYSLLESLEQPYEWIPELYEHCQSRGVQFMSSPFDERSVQELAEYVPAFKVASFTLSHHPFLEELSEYGKPVIMSTGAHEQDEVEEAVAVLRENGVEDIALLHCVSSYPTPLEEINVRAVDTLDREFDTVVGFSDHTTDPATAPAAAVALGASVVEKHFTLDKEMDGPDHSFALEPTGLRQLVKRVRQTKQCLGNGNLSISEVESDTVKRGRRRLYADQSLGPGEIIEKDSIKILRAGHENSEGIFSSEIEEVIGSCVKKRIEPDEPILWNNIDN